MKSNSFFMFFALVAASSCRFSASDGGVKEAFSTQDINGFFGGASSVETHLASLPTSGQRTPTPWHGHYWPSFRWGVLWRQFGEAKAPLEKFEAAFSTQLAADNSGYAAGQLATLEHQRTQGVSTQWAGICDGMSEAANSFPEPTAAKTVGGVTFYPYDIKALLGYFTSMSDPTRKMIFAGKRASTASVSFDTDGRPTDPSYRDVNPGLFHLALTNFLGKQNRALVANVIPGGMVLNFALRGFDVRSTEEVTDPSELAELLRYNAAAKRIVKVTTDVHYADSHRVLETLPSVDQGFTLTYTYTLELTDDGRIIGGEWQGDSEKNHPDFLWTSTDGRVDVLSLTTVRLGKSLRVGRAMQALLNAADDPSSDSLLQARRNDPRNLAPYQIFAGWPIPPVPPGMSGMVP